MAMKRIVEKMLLLAMLAVLPACVHAGKPMTEKLAKKAGVVVLFDKYVDPTITKGNMIILRLKDKSRSDNWRTSILEMETCIDTKVQTMTQIPVNQAIHKLEIKENTCLIDTNSEHQDQNGISLDILGDDFVFVIDDQDGLRRYKIDKAIFYETYIDVPTMRPLGEENDMTRAMQYIAKMFEAYK